MGHGILMKYGDGRGHAPREMANGLGTEMGRAKKGLDDKRAMAA